ncbi:MAG: hypothetical protein LBU34_06215 [Planctomycetaceae bacterium]|jgi:hypothetical protein|nr:hypothetical protein [Planctomycetaceae bacterium]
MDESTSPIDYPKGLTFEKVWASIQEIGVFLEREAKERVEYQKTAEERLKKLEKVVEKTSRSLDDTNKKIGHLGLRFGELIEHLIAPGVADRFREMGYYFDEVMHPFGFKFKLDGLVVAQADIVLENQDTVLIIEVKAKPDNNDVQNFTTKMFAIRNYYGQNSTQKNKKLIGALAGAIFPRHVKQFAVKSGFFVLTQRGDTVKIDVPKGFNPRNF